MVNPMTDTSRYDLMMEALTELEPEIRAARRPGSALRPSLRSVLQEFLPLPSQAVFLGIAADGFPVLLSLADPTPGPLLVAGDAGSGKTSLLQVIARAAEECSEPGHVQYGVITPSPEEWNALPASAHQVDIFPAGTSRAQDFIQSLDDWAHSNRNDHRTVLLLIDDLVSLMEMPDEALQSLRWLLLRGPSRRVWPIVSINPKKVSGIDPWLALFRTRLFGRIREVQDARMLSDGGTPRLDNLEAGNEFMLREGNGWLKFWSPTLD